MRDSFNFDYFLVISPCTKYSNKTKNKNKKERKIEQVANSSRFYINFEDEFLEQNAEFTFSIMQENHEYVIMLILREKHKQALENLSSMLAL